MYKKKKDHDILGGKCDETVWLGDLAGWHMPCSTVTTERLYGMLKEKQKWVCVMEMA